MPEKAKKGTQAALLGSWFAHPLRPLFNVVLCGVAALLSITVCSTYINVGLGSGVAENANTNRMLTYSNYFSGGLPVLMSQQKGGRSGHGSVRSATERHGFATRGNSTVELRRTRMPSLTLRTHCVRSWRGQEADRPDMASRWLRAKVRITYRR